MRKKLVLVVGAVVFGVLAFASPAAASEGGPSATGSPGSIGVPTTVES